MSGWLDKRGGQDASKGWKKRWCILSDDVIRYYRSESDKEPAGTIFGEDIEDVYDDLYESQKDSAKYGSVFKVVIKGRDYVFNAASGAKRDEWIKKIKELLDEHRSEVPELPEVRYATVEVFVNKGVRVNGEIGPVLTAQLATPTSKTSTDDRGWYCDNPVCHTAVLNLFTQHGWSLATAFQCNTFLPGASTSSVYPSDTLIFTHPYNA